MHPLDKFQYCPVCGSKHFLENNKKSKKCDNCGFVYYINPSSATVAFIMNDKGQLLVTTRKNNPAKGTLDLPGGFADLEETSEEAIIREVKEETGLDVTEVKYLFSLPNKYMYSNFEVPTLDMFYYCKVKDDSVIQALDDAAKTEWIALRDIHTELFGLRSIRHGLYRFLEEKDSLLQANTTNCK